MGMNSSINNNSNNPSINNSEKNINNIDSCIDLWSSYKIKHDEVQMLSDLYHELLNKIMGKIDVDKDIIDALILIFERKRNENNDIVSHEDLDNLKQIQKNLIDNLDSTKKNLEILDNLDIDTIDNKNLMN